MKKMITCSLILSGLLLTVGCSLEKTAEKMYYSYGGEKFTHEDLVGEWVNEEHGYFVIEEDYVTWYLSEDDLDSYQAGELEIEETEDGTNFCFIMDEFFYHGEDLKGDLPEEGFETCFEVLDYDEEEMKIKNQNTRARYRIYKK